LISITILVIKNNKEDKMKNIVKLFIVIIVAFAIIISPVWLKTRTLKIRNATLDVSNIETVKAINSQFKMAEVNKPNIPLTRGVFYDPYGDYLNYLHFNNDQQSWVLTITSLDGRIVRTIDLGAHKSSSSGRGKICFDKNTIYVGVDEMIIFIRRKDYSVERIQLSPRKYDIKSDLIPNRDTSDSSIIDIEKVGKYIAISRNNANGILLFDVDRRKFDEWKLPEEFGSVNKIIKFSEDILFVTNFYSGKGSYLIQDQFGKLNLATREFDIFSQPVQKLFVVENSVWGVDIKGNLFVLDNELKHIKTYNLGVFIVSGVVHSNGKIWFVGSDVDSIDGKPLLSTVSDDPPTDAVEVINLKTDKQILFIGCFDPTKEDLEKSYLPISKPRPVIGIHSPDINLDKINGEFKSSITIPTGIIDAETHGVFLFADKVFQINR